MTNKEKEASFPPKIETTLFLHNLPRNCVSDIGDSGTQKTQIYHLILYRFDKPSNNTQ